MLSPYFLVLLSGWLVAGVSLLMLVFGGAVVQAASPPLLEETRLSAPPVDEKPQTGLKVVTMTLAGKRYRVEVAATPEQAEKGLMYRTVLPAGHGMLFLFNPPRAVSFWMKNTKIPLDMVFLQKGAVVQVTRNVQPCAGNLCAIYSSSIPVDMVLELPAGTADADNILPGATAKVRLRAHAGGGVLRLLHHRNER